MRMIPTSGSTIFSAQSSREATNCMSRAYKDRAGSLRRTSAMLIRQARDRVVTRARVELHRRRLQLLLQR